MCPALQLFVIRLNMGAANSMGRLACDFHAKALCDVQVTDLSNVLHLVGGTAAAFMIFFLPGMLLINAAIIKESASTADLAAMEVR